MRGIVVDGKWAHCLVIGQQARLVREAHPWINSAAVDPGSPLKEGSIVQFLGFHPLNPAYAMIETIYQKTIRGTRGKDDQVTYAPERSAAICYVFSELLQGIPPRKKVRPTRENQSRNGVKVIVHRTPGEGTVVEADCACFGNEMRAHSTTECPVFKRQERRLKKGKS